MTVPILAYAETPQKPVAGSADVERTRPDDRPTAREQRRRALRDKAVNGVLRGKIKPVQRGGSTVAELTGSKKGGARDYVELARERTDRAFAILVEFGDKRHPDFPDVDSEPDVPGPTVFDGPRHNKILRPDRAVDNTTLWRADYNREFYQDLLFGSSENSLKSYYEKQSSGRYSVTGEVADWVQVDYNEARYGRGPDSDTGFLVKDAIDKWVAGQKATGRTDAEIKQHLQSFDTYDENDADGDGVFNEPDGVIDHFLMFHAGGSESRQDPQQGEDAIWSHNGSADVKIGDTGLKIEDYTVQPENAGMSVVAHEFGHSLGLSDAYDILHETPHDNIEFWSLMGNNRLAGKGEVPGTRPGDLGAWEKLQLGWLDHETVKSGGKRTVELGPQAYHTDKPQAVVVTLPDKQTPTDIGSPAAGEHQYFSGNNANADTAMIRTVDLSGASAATLAMKARYDLDSELEFLSVEASTDDGASWTALDGTTGGAAFGKDADGHPAVTGSTDDKWVDLTVDLTRYAGGTPQLRLRYRSGAATIGSGFFADDLTITKDDTVVLTDGAEADTSWTLKGFVVEDNTGVELTPQSYIAGYRADVSYDRNLASGPHQAGWASSKPRFVEHFPYQHGLVIAYHDESKPCNCIGMYPGGGNNMIIDAHPAPLKAIDGSNWGSRVAMYDAPFGLRKVDSLTLHLDGKESPVTGAPAQPLFDDTQQYYFDGMPWGVKLPKAGVKMKVVTQTRTTMTVKIS
ncbi:immune inhibitor A domain-containing protein [Actinoplanes sp. NPDC049548]|uniref:immune inhibitor A domain-containing protein n=1 Tax=Actinoplanes sp. NPDC049548 TaxID=3155152 RepID=UPI003417806D